MVEVICGWCKKEFDAKVDVAKGGQRSSLTCPYCSRTVVSSIKEPTENIEGRKHIHRELRKGDIV